MKLDFVRCLKQPFSGSNWIFNILIGAGLGLIAALAAPYGLIGMVAKIVASGFTAGYAARVMLNTATSNANSALPDWLDQPLPTFLQGIMLSFGITIYMMIFSLLGALIAAPFGVSTGLTGAAAVTAAAGPIMIVMLVLGLFAVPFVAMLAVHFSVEGRFLAFIEVGQAFSRMRSRPLTMLVATLTTMALLFLSGIVSTVFMGLLATMPVLGFAFVLIVNFVGQLMLANLWAQAYRG